MIRLNTMGHQPRAGDGELAQIFRSKRRAMHPVLAREMDLYLSTEVPVMVEVSGSPKSVAKEMEEIKARVADTLDAFKAEF